MNGVTLSLRTEQALRGGTDVDFVSTLKAGEIR